MHVDLRITESYWARLRQHFAQSFRHARAAETGALAIVGHVKTRAKEEFVVSKILLPEAGDLKTATSGEVVFDASYLRRAHLEMRKAGLAGIVTFHTHPFADTAVTFSGYDDHEDPLLAENLIELEPRTTLISVVAGRQSQAGRLYSRHRMATRLRHLIVVGDHLSYLSLDGQPPPPPPPPEAIFDRGRSLTGAGALARLAQMTVVVVGASGTGSLVCELLLRAGCKRIILIDHDVVKIINLNRVLHATTRDAHRGRAKVDVLKRALERLGFDCHVHTVHGSILDRDILRHVLDGDVVIGCVDRALPRHLLCELSYRYLLPYIDIGSEIGGDEDGIVSLDSRVSYVAPGRNCLMCTGIVTPRGLHFESLTHAERQRQIALGYSDDLIIEQPAVMDLNMRAASSGMLLLRHLLQPFLKEPYPVTLAENSVTYRSIPVSVARAANPSCRTCQSNRRFGYADCGPPVGYDADTVRRIFGPERPASAHPIVCSMAIKIPHFLRRLLALRSTH
jgi:NAD(P)-dependent dehydrogenase (short-subunit alcohol dehydrogenase family)